jgi:hypothetical protein
MLFRSALVFLSDVYLFHCDFGSIRTLVLRVGDVYLCCSMHVANQTCYRPIVFRIVQRIRCKHPLSLAKQAIIATSGSNERTEVEADSTSITAVNLNPKLTRQRNDV